LKNEDGLLKAGTKLADAQVSLPFYQPFVAEVQSSSVVDTIKMIGNFIKI
jgi:beta-galactosidase